MKKPKPKTPGFDELFPHLSRWITEFGQLEIGYDPETNSFIRALGQGGGMWQGRPDYPTVEAALADAEKGVARYMKKEFGVTD